MDRQRADVPDHRHRTVRQGLLRSERGRQGCCGAVLFRFLAKHANGEGELRGHAKWGAATKNVQISTWEQDAKDWPGGRQIDLYVGDGHDFGERSENMPKFHGEYKRIGNARCWAR